MNFLQRAHKAKELEIQHTKKQLEQKNAMMLDSQLREDDDDASGGGDNYTTGSAPDSVASSLTDSTARSTEGTTVCTADGEQGCAQQQPLATCDGAVVSSSGDNKSGDTATRKEKNDDDNNGVEGGRKKRTMVLPPPLAPNRKKRPTKQDTTAAAASAKQNETSSSGGAETSSMSEDESGNSPGGKNIAFNSSKPCHGSSVSDMTNSNGSSSTAANGEAPSATAEGGSSSACGGSAGGSSISSTAAVVRGQGSKQNSSEGQHHHNRRHGRRSSTRGNADKQNEGSTSRDGANAGARKRKRGFDYDYREVFVKSNVPQLIATLSGRIVACKFEMQQCAGINVPSFAYIAHAMCTFYSRAIAGNEFFLKATGLGNGDAKRLTIFGIVQSNQLSNLYKMVARALAADERSQKSGRSNGSNGTTNIASGASSSNSKGGEEWQAITLKCIPFHQQGGKEGEPKTKAKTKDSDAPSCNPLYITVALMEDKNRDQRCFHCVLTDCPGINDEGKVGGVSPELFATLLSPKRSKENVVAASC